MPDIDWKPVSDAIRRELYMLMLEQQLEKPRPDSDSGNASLPKQ